MQTRLDAEALVLDPKLPGTQGAGNIRALSAGKSNNTSARNVTLANMAFLLKITICEIPLRGWVPEVAQA
jgi:hypothetical protein